MEITQHLTNELKVTDVPITFPANAAERLYEEIKNILGRGKITSANMVAVLLSLMQIVENYSDVKGVQKKAIILDALTHIIDDQIDDTQEAMNLKLLVQMTLPSVIDTFVSLDKKEISIKLKKTCSKLFGCCRFA